MANTTANDVIESFESEFVDKHVLPESLEIMWLKKAVGRYSTELTELQFDEDMLEFNCKLKQYVIDTLAKFMMQMYQQRQVSLANKRTAIVGKDLSIDGNNGSKTAERLLLDRIESEAIEMVENQKETAFV